MWTYFFSRLLHRQQHNLVSVFTAFELQLEEFSDIHKIICKCRLCHPSPVQEAQGLFLGYLHVECAYVVK